MCPLTPDLQQTEGWGIHSPCVWWIGWQSDVKGQAVRLLSTALRGKRAVSTYAEQTQTCHPPAQQTKPSLSKWILLSGSACVKRGPLAYIAPQHKHVKSNIWKHTGSCMSQIHSGVKPHYHVYTVLEPKLANFMWSALYGIAAKF